MLTGTTRKRRPNFTPDMFPHVTAAPAHDADEIGFDEDEQQHVTKRPRVVLDEGGACASSAVVDEEEEEFQMPPALLTLTEVAAERAPSGEVLHFDLSREYEIADSTRPRDTR